MDRMAAIQRYDENEILTGVKYMNWQELENTELVTSYHDVCDDEEYADLINAQKKHLFES